MNERLESSRFPYLPIRVDLRGRTYELEALVDTGFDGDVSIPVSTIGNGGPPDYDAGAVLALGDEPSVDPGITNRFRLIFDHGERVIVEP